MNTHTRARAATDGDNIMLRDFVDISVAVATPDGSVRCS